MNLETFFPAKRRVHRRRRVDVPAASPPVVGLAMVGVQEVAPTEGGLYLTVVFNTDGDAPLNPVDGADVAKWNAVYQGYRYTGAGMMWLAYNQLRLSFNVFDEHAGPDVVNYTNNPSDISDTLGRELAAGSVGM